MENFLFLCNETLNDTAMWLNFFVRFSAFSELCLVAHPTTPSRMIRARLAVPKLQWKRVKRISPSDVVIQLCFDGPLFIAELLDLCAKRLKLLDGAVKLQPLLVGRVADALGLNTGLNEPVANGIDGFLGGGEEVDDLVAGEPVS